jgi:hypothetical protein
MVEPRIEDGRRIAELLASEVTGHEDGLLASLSVVDADRSVEPTDSGAFAYGVDCDGDRLCDVSVRPAEAVLALRVDTAAAGGRAEAPGLESRGTDADGALLLAVTYGAAVKAAVEVLVAAAEARSEDDQS